MKYFSYYTTQLGFEGRIVQYTVQVICWSLLRHILCAIGFGELSVTSLVLGLHPSFVSYSNKRWFVFIQEIKAGINEPNYKA